MVAVYRCKRLSSWGSLCHLYLPDPHETHHVPLSVVHNYPQDARDLPGPKNSYSPKGVPDVAFTAELDGVNTMSQNEDLPGLAYSKPTNVSGMVTVPSPSPGNNTVPMYIQQQLRLGYYSGLNLVL